MSDFNNVVLSYPTYHPNIQQMLQDLFQEILSLFINGHLVHLMISMS